MEPEDVCSDLLALIKLYRLLQNSGDPSHLTLDDITKLFLKKLLDGALEKVFGTHSKIRAAQSFIPNEPCCTPPIQPGTTTNLQPHVSHDNLQVSPTVGTNSFEDSNSQRVLLSNDEKLQDKQVPEATMKLQTPILEDILQASPSFNTDSFKDSNSHTVVPLKYVELLDKQMPEGKVPQLSLAHIPPTKPKNTKRRCRSCQQRSLKQQNLIRAIKRTNEKNPMRNTGKHHDPQHILDKLVVEQDDESVSNSNMLDSVENKFAPVAEKLLGSSSISLGTDAVKPSSEHNLVIEIDKKLEVVDHLSEEITEAIKQIKSRLQELRPNAKDIEPLEENSVKSTVQIPAQSEGIVRGNEISPVNDAHRNQGQNPFSAASSDLQIQEVSLHPIKNTRDQPSQLVSRKDGNTATTTSPHIALKPVLKPIVERADFSNTGHTNHVRAMIEKIESMNGLKIGNDHLPGQARKCVRVLRSSPAQGSTLPTEMPSLVNNVKVEQYRASQYDTSNGMSIITPPLQPQSLDPIDSVSSNKKVEEVKVQSVLISTLTGCNSGKINVHPSLYNDHMSEDQKRSENMHMTTVSPVLPQSVDPRDPMESNRNVQEARGQSMMNSALLDCSSRKTMMHPTLYDDYMSDHHKHVGPCKSIRFRPQRKIITSQKISEETSSSSVSSSSWRSEQTSTSYSVSDSESISESYSGSEYSSSLSRSKRSNYTSKRSSRRIVPKKEFRPEHQMNLVKQTGRLRKLKNKLGLIFHHHHHHHHHNQNNDNSDDDEGDNSDHAEAARAISLWTNMRKVFHSTNQNKVHNDHHSIVSSRKALVRNAATKKQHGHFHSLVEGLMKHIRHSKKSQPRRVGVKPLGSSRHGRDNKKVMKKFHWWQTLKRKRGAKLPNNKGRVKLGYGGKKSQLKPPKMR